MKRLAVALVAAALVAPASAQNVKIGVVTFLSGPAAAPFGVPAKNAKGCQACQALAHKPAAGRLLGNHARTLCPGARLRG